MSRVSESFTETLEWAVKYQENPATVSSNGVYLILAVGVYVAVIGVLLVWYCIDKQHQHKKLVKKDDTYEDEYSDESDWDDSDSDYSEEEEPERMNIKLNPPTKHIRAARRQSTPVPRRIKMRR